MATLLRATSPTSIVIGPFVSTGATAQTAIEVSSATIVDLYKITAKSDITTTAAGANAMAHVANGYYSLVLTSGNTDTVGPLMITADSTGSMSVWARYQVIPAAIYDALMTGTTTLDSTFANGAQASSLLAMGVSVASSLVWNQNGAMASATTAILTNYAQASLLATVDTVVDAIRVDVTSVLTNYSQASKLTAVQTDVTSILTNYAQASLLATVDTVVDAIRVDVTSVLTNYAQASKLTAVQTDITSVLTNYAQASKLTAVQTDITSVLTNYAQASKLTAVQTDVTSVLTNYAQASLLATVDTVVDAIRVDVTSVLTNYAQASAVAAVKVDTASSLTRIPAALVSGRIDASVGAMAADVMTTAAMTTTYVSEIADGVWDEILTGATHNIATSAGRLLRSIDSNEITSGTAQGATTNTITLAAGESSVNNWFDPGIIIIDSGTGTGQCRRIIEYNGTTKVATVQREWRTQPVAGSTYIIFADGGLLTLNDGAVTSAATSNITLNGVSQSQDDTYNGATVAIMSGTGKGQARVIADYDGATKVATLHEAWATVPAAADAYVIVPNGRAVVTQVLDGAISTTAFTSTTDLTTAQKAAVNAEVVDALATDTYAEPGQGAPAATEDLAAKIGYIYKFLRNKITTTSALTSVYADNGTTVDQKATVGDDGTTFTRGEFGTGA